MQNANFDDSSVHLQSYPNLKYEPNLEIIAKMDSARELCSLVLSLRKQHNLRTRLPLEYIKVFGYELAYFDNFKDIIESELNVKQLIYVNSQDVKLKTSIKLNFKSIGAKFGSKVSQITAAAKQNIFTHLADGIIEVAGEKLSPEDFTIINGLEDGYVDKVNEDWTGFTDPVDKGFKVVILKITSNPELEKEAIARDFVRAVQNARKSLNLDITAKISIEYSVAASDASFVQDALQGYCKYIQEQTIAQSLNVKLEDIVKDNIFTLDIEDAKISFCLTQV